MPTSKMLLAYKVAGFEPNILFYIMAMSTT